MATTTNKRVIVLQLRRQLESLEAMGYGDYTFEYMDCNSIEYNIDIGVHIVNDDNKTIVLG